MRVEDVHLSPRELQVLRLTADGFSIPEIAERVGLAERTVKQHSDTLRIKFNVSHRRQLIPIGQKLVQV